MAMLKQGLYILEGEGLSVRVCGVQDNSKHRNQSKGVCVTCASIKTTWFE